MVVVRRVMMLLFEEYRFGYIWAAFCPFYLGGVGGVDVEGPFKVQE